MKKFLTGAVCGAAIAAAAVVLLPVAAVKIAVHLSRSLDRNGTGRVRAAAETAQPGLLTGRDRGDEPPGLEYPVKNQVQSFGLRQDATWDGGVMQRP